MDACRLGSLATAFWKCVDGNVGSILLAICALGEVLNILWCSFLVSFIKWLFLADLLFIRGTHGLCYPQVVKEHQRKN